MENSCGCRVNVLVAIAEVPMQGGEIFSEGALRQVAAQNPNLFSMQGKRLYARLRRTDVSGYLDAYNTCVSSGVGYVSQYSAQRS